MNNNIINYYENYYREENRITTDNSRRIEYLTTCKYFDEMFQGTLKILGLHRVAGVARF